MTGKGIAAYLFAEGCTIHTGHHPVADNEVVFMFGQQVECFNTIVGCRDLILLTETAAEEFQHILGIVDDEETGKLRAGS